MSHTVCKLKPCIFRTNSDEPVMRARKMNHVVRCVSANNFARQGFQCKNLLQFPFTSSLCCMCWKNKYDSNGIQRCNGTTAGLGYLEIVWIVHANFPHGRLASVRTVNPHWGKMVQAFTDLNLNHKHTTAAPKLTSFKLTSSHL